MSTEAGALIFMGPKNQFFHAYNSITTSTGGSAEVGLIKGFTPDFTYRVFWEWTLKMNDTIAVPTAQTGFNALMPGLRIYASGFTSSNGDIMKWSPGTIYETHNEGSFILPQGTDGLAMSGFNLDGFDNVGCFLNVFGVRLSPISQKWKAYPWE